jgi:hypothetical protein
MPFRPAAVSRTTSANGFARRGVAGRRERVRDDFRVRLRQEVHARPLKALLEREEVLDDAVVDHDDPARGVAVRVGVLLGRAAVRRPARVPDPEPAGRGRRGDLLREVPELALAARDADLAVVPDDRDPRRIVAAVLEALQAVEEDGRRRRGRRRSPRSRTSGQLFFFRAR